MDKSVLQNPELYPPKLLSALECVFKAVEIFNNQLPPESISCYHELFVYTFQFRKKDNWLLDGETPKIFVSKSGLMNWQNLNDLHKNPSFNTQQGWRNELVLALSINDLENIESVDQVLELIYENAFV